MSHNWTEYLEPAPADREELYVSLSPGGRLVLARNTCRALGDPKHVILLWDGRTDSIGVRPVSGRAVNAFRLQGTGRYGANLITAARFLRRHELKLDETVRFPMAHIDEGVLVLDLHTRVPAVTGRRRKK